MIVIYPVFIELFMIHYMYRLLILPGNMLYAVKGFLIIHFRTVRITIDHAIKSFNSRLNSTEMAFPESGIGISWSIS